MGLKEDREGWVGSPLEISFFLMFYWDLKNLVSLGGPAFDGAPRVWAEQNIFWAQNTDERATRL